MITTKPSFTPLSLTILALFVSSCSTTRLSTPEKQDRTESAHQTRFSHAELADSSVDIIYILGHSQHRFTAEARSGKVIARAFLDKKILDEGHVDHLKYYDFVHKASSFTGPSRKTAAQDDAMSQPSCRAPFTVTIRLGKDAKTHAGCRLSDDGYLSRLVREGEFLLYSKK